MSYISDLKALKARQYAQATKEAKQRLATAETAYGYNLGQAQQGYDTTSAYNLRNRMASITGLDTSVWNQAADTGNVRGTYNKYARGEGMANIASAYGQAKYAAKTQFDQTKYANETAWTGAQQEYQNFLDNLKIQQQEDAMLYKNYGGSKAKPPPKEPTYEQAMQKYMSGGIHSQQDAQYVKAGFESMLRQYYREYEAYYGVKHGDDPTVRR